MFDYRLSQNEYDEILALKREIHMHPELAHDEFGTTALIRDYLAGLPDFALLGEQPETGLVVRIEGDGTGREVMLRADIDAIQQTEEYDSPWRSVNDGVMHACGHDFHTAALLGAARVLQRAKDTGSLKNTVDLVFQPAEEGTTGARMLIENGLFEVASPDAVFGLHNWPSVGLGRVVCHPGHLMAGKRSFEIMITGSGGHGSMPHLNRDPIVCSANVIQALQTVVSRNTDPADALVLSISMIEGGRPVNVVADNVRIVGTIRSLSDKALDNAITRVEAIVVNASEAFGVSGEVSWQPKIPALNNSPALMDHCVKCVRDTGLEPTDCQPGLASEDFALYQSIVPGFYYWMGCTPEGECQAKLHSPDYHTDDSLLGKAAELLARTAGEYR